ncbi:hypothetical protein H4R34_002897 [Dimargaris verticillata]|uniref:Secreted RxLR effector peptide protein n=1 Tax=Dimargaris verticillata TaxID=2761393 RepID=A0A9W8B342_9FUNG|nr:hypothetical protein H4R34_002897 [Dimargaris verticillata]
MQLTIPIVTCGALFVATVCAQPSPSQEQLVPVGHLKAADFTNVSSDSTTMYRRKLATRQEYNPTPEDIALWNSVINNIKNNGPKYQKGCMTLPSARMGRRDDHCPDDKGKDTESESDSDNDSDGD